MQLYCSVTTNEMFHKPLCTNQRIIQATTYEVASLQLQTSCTIEISTSLSLILILHLIKQ